MRLHGLPKRARQSVDETSENHSKLKEAVLGIDIAAYASLLRRCGDRKALSEGRRLHSILAKGGYDRQTFVGNLLVQMYGNCERLRDARAVFDKIRQRNVFSWNIMMAAYAQNGDLQEASSMFEKMPERNVVSWNSMIAIYVQKGHVDYAKLLFEKMPHWDVVSWNALIAAYTQTGHLENARRLFNTMIERNIISWNAMISAYAENGDVVEAKHVFEEMPMQNVVSWAAMITAYARKGHLEEAKIMFDNMPRPDVVSCTAMIVAYAQNGDIHEARIVFNSIQDQDIVSWTTMIAAYAQNGHGAEALNLFRLMDMEGMYPNNITLVSILEACSNLSAQPEGKLIHEIIADSGFQLNVVVSTALLNMYGRCGNVVAAKKLFDELPQKDVVAWNAIMAVYAHNGQGGHTLELFKVMLLEGVFPDDISFMSVLSVSSHAGLLSIGWGHFGSISADYGLMPVLDHYVCMIDLLGRAGRLHEAEELIHSMPFEPDAVSWRILLGACRNHGDMRLGARAADNVIDMDYEDAAPYLLLAHTYTSLPKNDGGGVRQCVQHMPNRHLLEASRMSNGAL